LRELLKAALNGGQRCLEVSPVFPKTFGQRRLFFIGQVSEVEKFQDIDYCHPFPLLCRGAGEPEIEDVVNDPRFVSDLTLPR
jgi:hypothetical protein